MTGLLRVLGPVGATAIVVGGVIGSGIFFKANVIAQSVGRFDLVLLVWIVCGLLSLCGALAVAELAASMPHAGGQYVYLREAYGPLTGFLWGWVEFWVLRTGSIAALAVAFASAFQRSIGEWLLSAGWLKAANEDGSQIVIAGIEMPSVWVMRSVAMFAIVMLTVVNVIGARWGGWVQNVTTFLKAGTLVALVVLPFLTGTSSPANLGTTFVREGSHGLIAGFVVAMSSAFWAYDGWNNIALVSEEVREPQRNVPLSLGLGMFILIALYLGATTAYHFVLSMSETAGAKFVAAAACERMLGHQGAAIASAAVMLSTFGALNANLLCGPRVIFAMARDGLFLKSMARVHPKFRTPFLAIVAESLWAIVLIAGSDVMRHIGVPSWISWLPSGLSEPLARSLGQMSEKAIFDVLTDYVVFGSFVFYILSVAAVFVLRRREPNRERPYRTWGYPYLPLIFVVASTGFLVSMLVTSPIESIAGLIFIGLGAGAYWCLYKSATPGRGNVTESP